MCPGVGQIFHCDVVGSSEQLAACCSGKGEKLIQGIIDEHTDANNKKGLWSDVFGSMPDTAESCICDLTVDEAENLTIKAFRAACEREITIGDGIEIVICRRLPSEAVPDEIVSSSDAQRDRRRLRRPFALTKKYISLPSH
jgi:20S proteasome alpha/beta subunit